MGLWRWKSLEIREERWLAPDAEDRECSRFTLWAWARGDDGITGFQTIGEEDDYDTDYKAMRHGWYFYFHSLRSPH